jgi:high-affinity Fe2+/Pb2+ permease
VTLADVAAGAGAPMPSFWQQNRLELSLLAALAAVAVGLVAIMVAVYDDELERFMRKLGRVLRREVAERPLLARYLL